MSAAAASQGHRRVAVVGAGITGLAAALRLIQQHKDLHVDMFEASSRAGGAIQTEHRDGFLIEHGPDAFITNKPGGLQLCSDLGITDQLIGTDKQHRRSLVVHRGRPVPVPEGFMLMAPAKPTAILKTPILSFTGKLRLLSEIVRSKKSNDDDESLASFVRRRFGTETFERLVQPLVGGIYTSDPERLSLKATLPRFLEMERQHGSVIRAVLAEKRSEGNDSQLSESGARYGLFATHATGLSSVVASIVSALKSSGRSRLHLNTAVDAVKPSHERTGGWHVKISDQNQMSFQGVILSTPSWVSAGILQTLDPILATELSTIECASTAIVTTGHRLKDFTHAMDAFGLVVPAVEDRRVLAISFSSRKFTGRAPTGHVLLRTFLGGATQPGLLDLSDQDIFEIVAAEQQQLLGRSQKALFATITRYQRAMPQYHVGHLELVNRIDERLSRQRSLELAGNAYRGVGIPDCISSGYTAADRLSAELSN
ncbi:MAG: protoporphyrinogen oxidase [Fuerstiella sp.]|nr:protoporphyrinogen oxidase [Fuerstiella sp.]